jgi:hypothetical protein
MIRHTTDARAHGAGDAPGSITLSASRRRVEAFVRDLGYPADRVEEAVYRFRRERGAMTVEDAAAHLAEWIESIHRAHHGTARSLSVEDASTAFVLSGAAMWSADTLFAEPASLPAAHRAAIASGASSVVPDERPLTMPAQDLTGRRWGRRRVEPTVRRLSWVPSR